MKTTYSTKAKDIKRSWWHVDAKDKVLGRLCTEIAKHLIGKHKTQYVTHLDCGDYIVVTNVEQIAVTGKKAQQKMYYRHSGYPGGFREASYEQVLEKDPRKIVWMAVKGMLPKNKLQDRRLKRLKLFKGEAHPYQEKSVQELAVK